MNKLNLDQENRTAYLEGLKRYKEQGVRILLDGEEVDDSKWEAIFEVQEDGSFYMGDYILEEEVEKFSVQVCERKENYGVSALTGKRLKEIRFDRVYNR